jgi:hypothetical protein
MRISGVALSIFALALFLVSATAKAQQTDKQKLMYIEKAFAAAPNASPAAGDVSKQYLFEGTVHQLTPLGRVGALPKARVVALSTTPDPSDPDVKSTQTVSDFSITLYGDTAMVAYKLLDTDTGHQDPALNTTDHMGCLDTFVKRTGQWYIVGNACSPAAPLPKSEWDASMKAMMQAPKDVQQAYH